MAQDKKTPEEQIAKFDHNGDGRPGGSLPKNQRSGSAKAEGQGQTKPDKEPTKPNPPQPPAGSPDEDALSKASTPLPKDAPSGGQSGGLEAQRKNAESARARGEEDLADRRDTAREEAQTRPTEPTDPAAPTAESVDKDKPRIEQAAELESEAEQMKVGSPTVEEEYAAKAMSEIPERQLTDNRNTKRDNKATRELERQRRRSAPFAMREKRPIL